MKNTFGEGAMPVATRRGPVRRHLGRLVAVLGIVTAMIVGSAGAAMAAPFAAHKCQLKSTHTICIHIRDVGGGMYSVDVELDVKMSQAAAQTIIDEPFGEVFSGILQGSDFPFPQTLDPFFGRELARAASFGLVLNFNGIVTGSLLNQDIVGTDEVFVFVAIRAPSSGVNLNFLTPTVSHGF